MTTYTLVPNSQASLRSIDWGDPASWAGGFVPNGSGADVVIAAPAAGAGASDVEVASAYTVHSLSLAENYLTLDNGSLTVTGAVDVVGGLIELGQGTAGAGTLAAGALSNAGGIQGRGTITCSGAVLNEGGATMVGSGLSITASSFDNAGLLEAASGDLTLTTPAGGFANLSGSTLTGAYAAGFASNTQSNVIFLNAGSVVATDAGSITLNAGGDMASWDDAKSAYAPIEATMQDIAWGGMLTLSQGAADSWGRLAVDGLLRLEGADLTTTGLTVDPGGTAVGVGSISGPVVDNGTIIAGQLSTYVPQVEFAAGTSAPPLHITGAISGSGTLRLAPAPSISEHLTTYYYPATVELGSAASVNVAFSDGHGALVLDDPSAFTGSIAPAAAGDQIQLAGIALSSVSGDSYAAGPTGGVLTIDLNGGAQIQLHVAAAGDQSFSLSAGPQVPASAPPSLLITYDGASTPAPTPAPDLIRDHFSWAGVSDLLIENTAGAVVAGQIVDGTETYATVAGLGPEWTFEGTGDFLGDGESDVLIENARNGELVVGEVSSGAPAYTEVGGLGPEWRFEGTGDFLGPGQGVTPQQVGGGWDQVLIENPSGALALATVVNGQATYSAIGGLGPEWTVVGAGAYLGDGQSQFLIESTSGAVDVGEVTGGATSVRYTQAASLGPGWNFVESGDFLGDGKVQFLIENANGALALGEVGRNDAVQYTLLGGLGPEWKFVGAGEYLGDGRDQFAIENTNGAVVLGDCAGGQVRFAQVGGLGPEWSFRG